MTFVIIIFLMSIILAFGMLSYRSWEIKTARIEKYEKYETVLPELPFRRLEKNVLYLTKHIIQGLIVFSAKYWFIVITKSKKWFNDKWPKINAYFLKKKNDSSSSYRHSFLKKAILESKAKIKHIKEKVKEEIGEEEEKKEE